MGHLDNVEKAIEVRLTSLGRKRLAEGEGFEITQFALSDDEVDYGLWQEDLPPEDRGALIENLPTFEAVADENQSLRYKLISVDGIPEISLPEKIRLDSSSAIVSPTTTVGSEETTLDRELGYTVYVEDENLLNVKTIEPPRKENATIPADYGKEISQSNFLVAVGSEFEINRASDDQFETTITVIGNETGLSFELEIVAS